MKNSLLIACLAAFSSVAYSQSFYDVKALGSNYPLELVNQAFQNAEFCGAYLETERNTLVFNDGCIVELKSRNEIIADGNSIEPECIAKGDVKMNEVLWSISSTGVILRGSNGKLSGDQKTLIQE